LATVSTPTITQATPTTDVATHDITITSQAPFASAVTNLTAGNIVLSVPAPVSGTANGMVKISVGGSTLFQMGRQAGTSSNSAIYPIGSTPSSTNYWLLSDNTNAWLQAPGTSGQLLFLVGGLTTQNTTQAGTQFFNSGTVAFGGGSRVIGIGNAVTVPTSVPATPTLYSNTGVLETTSAGLQFNNLTTSPIILHRVAATDVATTNLTLTPQAPFASAVTNVLGGNLVVALAAPVSGTAESSFKITRGGTLNIQLGPYPTAPSYGTLWMGTSPSTSNFVIANNGLTTQVNATTSVTLSTNNTNIIGFLNTSGFQFFNGGTAAFGGGNKVIGIGNATTIPTSLPSGGLALYSNLSGALEQTGGGYSFSSLVQSPTIAHATALTDVATTSIVIAPQAPFASAVTNLTAGSLVVSLSNPVSGATYPMFVVKQNNVAVAGLSQDSSGSGTGLLYLGPGTVTNSTTSYVVANANSGQTYLNSTGTTGTGAIHFQVAAVDLVTIGINGIYRKAVGVPLTTGTVSLSSLQYCLPKLNLTGSLTGNVILTFPTTADGAEWVVENNCTMNGFTITLKANGNNWGTVITTTATSYFVEYSTTIGRLVGTTLST
jgi:hypothetical protein